MLMLAFGTNRRTSFDDRDEYAEMSETARYFGGGIIDHADALVQLSHRLPTHTEGWYRDMKRLYILHGAGVIDQQ